MCMFLYMKHLLCKLFKIIIQNKILQSFGKQINILENITNGQLLNTVFNMPKVSRHMNV